MGHRYVRFRLQIINFHPQVSASRQTVAIIIKATTREFKNIIWQRIEITDIGRTGAGEITVFHIVTSFSVLKRLDQFGNEEIGIRPALAVRM